MAAFPELIPSARHGAVWSHIGIMLSLTPCHVWRRDDWRQVAFDLSHSKPYDRQSGHAAGLMPDDDDDDDDDDDNDGDERALLIEELHVK